MKLINALIRRMAAFDAGDAKRIQHFIKVHSFCRYIGEEEGLSGEPLRILEAAAVMHDIGVIPAEQAFGNCAGPYQEKLGPPLAMEMFDELAKDIPRLAPFLTENLRSRVRYLIGHHHTYNNVDGMDHRILLESDFLVNLYEKNAGTEEIRSAYEKIFRTVTGKTLCRNMFPDAFQN